VSSAPTDWHQLYPFESHYADIGGVRMHYVDEGTGPPVVMLHGNPTWSFMYRELIAAVSATRRVIAPDHIGCGLSEKPADYTYRLATHVANVATLLDDVLGLPALDLVVHDWGGAIGMGYAVERPQKIRRLVVTNSAAFLGGRCPWRIRLCRIPLFGPVAVCQFNGFARAALHMATARPGPLRGPVADGFIAPYGSPADRIALLRFVQDIPLAPGHPTWHTVADIQGKLHRLRDTPAMVCWGEKDWCFTTKFLDRWLEHLPQAAVARFPEAGHYLLEDAGAPAIDQIACFLEGDR